MTARARALFALGAYLCLAAHLAGLVHVLVVRHATCPSHGEVVHGDLPEAPAVPSEGATFSGHPTAPADEDEHCLYLATRRRDLALLPAPAAALEPRLAEAAAPAPDAPPLVLSSAALLRLAPKTSPPAAA
jgi:hypothetical protein